jgi:predicted O-linked N-acetylglucosamine transferase (SPINDLY family)
MTPDSFNAESESRETTAVQTLVAHWSIAELVQQTQILEAQGLREQACVAYQIWLVAGLQPQLAHAALFNLGALQQVLGQWDEAQASYHKAITLAPGFGQAYVNLGLLLERCGQVDAALQTWSQFLGQRLLKTAHDTDIQCAALNHIGRLQESRKHYDLAEQALADSLRLNPDQPGVIQHWVHIRQKACRWPVYEELPGLPISKQVRATSPLAMLALSDDPQLQLLTAQNFVNRTYTTAQARLHDPARVPGQRWRVGLVSADLREHAVGFLLPAFLHGVKREQYALYAYDYTREESTPLRQQLLSLFDVVRPIAELSDQQAAEQMAADQIDILIDLHGLSSGARPGIFALHPAPRQVTYLGYIGSTGMPWFDHVLVDGPAMPAELTTHFTEKPVRLSRSFIPLTHETPVTPALSRQEAGLPEQAFVMAGFGNVYKITPEVFSSWLRLLQRIDGAVLWLLDDNPVTTKSLKDHARAQGADLQRLVFAPRCDPQRFRAQLRLADVYLDTYPYNCGSTSNDVVNAGVPLVSRFGPTLVSRMGLSILSELGRTDLAVPDQQAYEDKVFEVAVRTRAGYCYRYEHRPPGGMLQEALDTIRLGVVHSPGAPTPLAPARRVLSLTLPATPVCHSQPSGTGQPAQHATALSALALQAWADFAALKNQLIHLTLDARCLYLLDHGKVSDPSGVATSALRSAISACASPDHEAVLASPGWDLNSLHANPFQVWHEHPQWLDWAQSYLRSAGFTIDLQDWVLPVEKSLLGLSLACTPALWFDWLALANPLHQAAHEPAHPEHAALQRRWTCGDSELTSAQMLYPLLMNLVLLRRGSCSTSLDPFSLIPLGQDARSHYPFAVQCAALKKAWSDTGLKHYKTAYRQLVGHQALKPQPQ